MPSIKRVELEKLSKQENWGAFFQKYNVNELFFDEIPVVFWLIQNSNPALADFMLGKMTPQAVNLESQSITVLNQAIKTKNPHLVLKLLARGADPFHKSIDTALAELHDPTNPDIQTVHSIIDTIREFQMLSKQEAKEDKQEEKQGEVQRKRLGDLAFKMGDLYRDMKDKNNEEKWYVISSQYDNPQALLARGKKLIEKELAKRGYYDAANIQEGVRLLSRCYDLTQSFNYKKDIYETIKQVVERCNSDKYMTDSPRIESSLLLTRIAKQQAREAKVEASLLDIDAWEIGEEQKLNQLAELLKAEASSNPQVNELRQSYIKASHTSALRKLILERDKVLREVYENELHDGLAYIFGWNKVEKKLIEGANRLYEVLKKYSYINSITIIDAAFLAAKIYAEEIRDNPVQDEEEGNYNKLIDAMNKIFSTIIANSFYRKNLTTIAYYEVYLMKVMNFHLSLLPLTLTCNRPRAIEWKKLIDLFFISEIPRQAKTIFFHESLLYFDKAENPHVKKILLELLIKHSAVPDARFLSIEYLKAILPILKQHKELSTLYTKVALNYSGRTGDVSVLDNDYRTLMLQAEDELRKEEKISTDVIDMFANVIQKAAAAGDMSAVLIVTLRLAERKQDKVHPIIDPVLLNVFRYLANVNARYFDKKELSETERNSRSVLGSQLKELVLTFLSDPNLDAMQGDIIVKAILPYLNIKDMKLIDLAYEIYKKNNDQHNPAFKQLFNLRRWKEEYPKTSLPVLQKWARANDLLALYYLATQHQYTNKWGINKDYEAAHIYLFNKIRLLTHDSFAASLHYNLPQDLVEQINNEALNYLNRRDLKHREFQRISHLLPPKQIAGQNYFEEDLELFHVKNIKNVCYYNQNEETNRLFIAIGEALGLTKEELSKAESEQKLPSQQQQQPPEITPQGVDLSLFPKPASPSPNAHSSDANPKTPRNE